MTDNGYGLWFLVVFNSLLFIFFAASFFHPQSKRDWRALGGFSAFIVALFTEMYGYPLSVYLLSGPLSGLIPGVNLSHNSGHLWNDLIGWKGDAHVSPFHLASYVVIGGGFWLIATGWKHLYEAQKTHRLATTGPYAYVRHPQYAGFVLIMVGFLLQWPTFATLLMFPVLLLVYRKLAIREEREVAIEFGSGWEAYAEELPRFVPRLRQLVHRHTASRQEARPPAVAEPALAPARIAGRDTRGRRP
jgi:protein-S-isoprenylcysteine O-methyltransferase Ste14